ncbi:hypothetical protein E3P77_03340 [Wallemia ichthyophaga]|uniref:Uncharacterized protein n=1 Tax=Wallemia ichthyophaga (strain EXF-994 / CBS 113033) TaxID=1299270 RepID=R9ATX7_WALI9|nr:uncharacterized protein J056_002993 [Wallemia ichthyophaga EXF-994]TIA79026.1 hypothetical protein E3P98_03532 [Wallemia ichthyophaga]EOR03536.1 hypothetical protein J056_002993 [Wallemia ichthyophaga EXF-994]TIB31816.1 hypothetical protein E3P84_02795 [Wallemia ichthyophaga]TIB40710.1 hypothetical protein E3P83_02732 [Wallemia ichthyophaga]TIB63972.1 hypothetical protein E3P77_03340 [Wallemia ichthyophaga]
MIEIANVVNADADPAAAAAVDQLGGLIAFFLPPALNNSTSTLLNVLLDLAVLFCFISTLIGYICWGLVLTREDRRIESTDMETGQHVQLVYSSPVDK